jgi:hypothetical protein
MLAGLRTLIQALFDTIPPAPNRGRHFEFRGGLLDGGGFFRRPDLAEPDSGTGQIDSAITREYVLAGGLMSFGAR